MYVISKKENEHIIDVFRVIYPDISFNHKYYELNEILEPGLTITEDTISYSKANGIKINRKRMVLVILATKEKLDGEFINEIRSTLSDIFHIYTEDISEVQKYIDKQMVDTFEFRNYIDSIFKDYLTADYLFIL